MKKKSPETDFGGPGGMTMERFLFILKRISLDRRKQETVLHLIEEFLPSAKDRQPEPGGAR